MSYVLEAILMTWKEFPSHNALTNALDWISSWILREI